MAENKTYKKITKNGEVEILKATASEPIKNLSDIQKIKDLLYTAKTRKYYVLFCCGINTAFRIGDLVKLQVKDIKGEYIEVVEEKTNKHRKIKINAGLRPILQLWIEENKLTDTDYLFFKSNNKKAHINRSIAYRTLTKAILTICPNLSAGTHTLRKTFAWHMYHNLPQHEALPTLQKLLNHTSSVATLHYIGLTQQSLDNAVDSVCL